MTAKMAKCPYAPMPVKCYDGSLNSGECKECAIYKEYEYDQSIQSGRKLVGC